MAIPKDPMILMSYVNTQLRDFYSSLDELCSALDLIFTIIRRETSLFEHPSGLLRFECMF